MAQAYCNTEASEENDEVGIVCVQGQAWMPQQMSQVHHTRTLQNDSGTIDVEVSRRRSGKLAE